MPGKPVATQPDFVPLMLATPARAPFDDPDWLFELKWDGYRVEAVVREGRARIWTRNRLDAARHFPELAGAADWLNAREAIVDGEVVAVDPDGRPRFDLIARPGRRIVYQVFDLLWLDGVSLLERPLEERKARLRERLNEGPLVRYTAHVIGDGRAFFAATAEQGLEGVVAKDRRSHYEPGRRSRHWLKLKARREQELVVVGWEPGRAAHADLGALLLAVRGEDGALRYAGEVGSGLDRATRTELLRTLRPIERDRPAIANPPVSRHVQWVDPHLVARVEFAEWTRDGLIRQAAFKGLDPAKIPGAVRREEPSLASVAAVAGQATAAELVELDRLGSGGRWSIGDRVVNLTNLTKPLFPEVGLTKRDLIRYYVTVAPVLLPYLRDRGLTLDRWPDGPGGPHFWHKEIPAYAPGWVSRWRHESHDPAQSHTYVVADSVATLAFLANQAAIDLHPWTSRIDAPERPTYALIDIDPGDKTTWSEVLVLARLYRAALAHLGVRACPKLTGKRGLQIWVPIEPRYTFRETAAWVEALSRAVAAAAPELVSWEWSVAGRRGLARLDYTQNAPNKTLVAPYAVRPLAAAPVSAPITWSELDDPDLRPGRWTIQTMPERLRARGDLFANALRYDQQLPRL